jgi:hypothetical protein
MAPLHEKYIGYIGFIITFLSFFTNKFLLPGISLGFNLCILLFLLLKMYLYDLKKITFAPQMAPIKPSAYQD